MAADAVTEFCRDVRELLPEFEAEQIKSIGDAVMVRVPDGLGGDQAGGPADRRGRHAARLAGRARRRPQGRPSTETAIGSGGGQPRRSRRRRRSARRGPDDRVTHSAAGGACPSTRSRPGPSQTFKNVAEPVTCTP